MSVSFSFEALGQDASLKSCSKLETTFKVDVWLQKLIKLTFFEKICTFILLKFFRKVWIFFRRVSSVLFHLKFENISSNKNTSIYLRFKMACVMFCSMIYDINKVAIVKFWYIEYCVLQKKNCLDVFHKIKDQVSPLIIN